MFKLIKNELFKVFHKKSTFILLIIMFAFVILTNSIYRFFIKDTVFYSNDIKEMEYTINNYVYNESNIDDIIYYNTIKDTYDVVKDYDTNSWQYNILRNNYYNLSCNYYESIYYNKSEDKTLLAKRKDILDRVTSGNWQSFVNDEIEDEKQQLLVINNEIDKEINQNRKNDLLREKFVKEERIKLLEYRIDENIPQNSDYLNNAIYSLENLAYEYYNYKNGINTNELSNNAIKEYYKDKYILENKVDLDNTKSLRGVLINFVNEYSFLILVFGILISGSIVSEEFNKGTIKTLLIMPFNRGKIIISKFITSIIMILFGILIMLLLQLVVGGILFGVSSLSIPWVTYNLASNSLVVINVFSYVFLSIIMMMPYFVLLNTFAFAISTIFTNTALATSLTFAGIIGTPIINLFRERFDLKFLDYFVTTCWDWSYYLFGGTSPYKIGLLHAVLVCLVYFGIMIVVSFIVFKKKDIKNI